MICKENIIRMDVSTRTTSPIPHLFYIAFLFKFNWEYR